MARPQMVSVHRLEWALAQILAYLRLIYRKEQEMAGELKELVREVAETRGLMQSAAKTIKGFREALDTAIAAGSPAALTSLSQELEAEQVALTEAIVANPLPGDPPPTP